MRNKSTSKNSRAGVWGRQVITCSVRYGLTPGLNAEQELRPTDPPEKIQRMDSLNLLRTEKMMFLKVPLRIKS